LVRRIVANGLAIAGARTELQAMSDDEDNDVALNVAEGLGALDDKRNAIAICLRLIAKNTWDFFKLKVVKNLVQLKAVDELLSLTSKEPVVAAAVAEGLYELGERRAAQQRMRQVVLRFLKVQYRWLRPTSSIIGARLAIFVQRMLEAFRLKRKFYRWAADRYDDGYTGDWDALKGRGDQNRIEDEKEEFRLLEAVLESRSLDEQTFSLLRYSYVWESWEMETLVKKRQDKCEDQKHHPA
jgi:hypothetical protein